jgi:cytoskeletal protein RodZ
VGKWYAESLSTKITRGTSCTLIDTVKYYPTKDQNPVYEFLENGKFSATTVAQSVTYTSTGNYSYSNGVLTMTVNGVTVPMNITNLNSSGFSIEQDNRSYCTNPYTKFKEYMNYKKY